MDDKNKLKIESEVLKKLLSHLQNRTDVQNIDLMNLSGFVETVFPDGILRLLRKMELNLIKTMLKK